MAAENFHALEDAAIGQLDFTHAEIGDGFKFGGDAVGHRSWRGDFTVADRLAAQPFSDPARLQRIRIEPHHEDGVVAAMMRAIVVFVPEKELVRRRVGINAIDERTGGLGGGPGGRRVKRINPGLAVMVGDDEGVAVKFGAFGFDQQRGFASSRVRNGRVSDLCRRVVCCRRVGQSGRCCA